MERYYEGLDEFKELMERAERRRKEKVPNVIRKLKSSNGRPISDKHARMIEGEINRKAEIIADGLVLSVQKMMNLCEKEIKNKLDEIDKIKGYLEANYAHAIISKEKTMVDLDDEELLEIVVDETYFDDRPHVAELIRRFKLMQREAVNSSWRGRGEDMGR